MHLSGWQRLWVVLSIVWGAMIVVAMTPDRPSRDKVYTEWANDLVLAMQARDPEITYEGLKAYTKAQNSREIVEGLVKGSRAARVAGWRQEVERIDHRYHPRLDDVRREQVRFWGTLLATWLGGAVLMYASGWAVGWVWRGFRSPRPVT